MNESERDNLNWTAFLYVTEELPETEAEAFEQRLTEDQAARDAVVQAVQMLEGLAPAESEHVVPTSPAPRRGHGRSRVVVVVSALCAVLLAGIAIQLWSSGDDSKSQIASETSLQERLDMLALWNEWSFEESLGDEASMEAGGTEPMAALDDSQETISTDLLNSADQEFEVPDWMIAALTPETSSGPEDAGDVPVEN